MRKHSTTGGKGFVLFLKSRNVSRGLETSSTKAEWTRFRLACARPEPRDRKRVLRSFQKCSYNWVISFVCLQVTTFCFAPHSLIQKKPTSMNKVGRFPRQKSTLVSIAVQSLLPHCLGPSFLFWANPRRTRQNAAQNHPVPPLPQISELLRKQGRERGQR